MRALLLLALTLGAGTVHAAPKVSASGYLRNLSQFSRSALNTSPSALNISRARVSLDVKESVFQFHVDYDQELLTGSFFRTVDYARFGLAEGDPWLSMDQTISTTTTSIWRHRLYRGWLAYETDSTTLRFGRQRIAWGTGRLWNPTDRLNPYLPTIVERLERPGIDALYLRQGLGDLSQAELAYAPHVTWARSAVLSRARTHIGKVDVSLMGGKTAISSSSWIVGGDFAGDMMEGTARAEWAYEDPSGRRPNWKAVIGYDYYFGAGTNPAWLKESNLTLEYFHNGGGESDIFRYNVVPLRQGQEVSLGRDLVGMTFSKEINPLLKVDLYLISNLNDLSHFAAPSLQWNALPDLYLSTGVQRFAGSRLTEYGRSPNLFFFQGDFHF